MQINALRLTRLGIGGLCRPVRLAHLVALGLRQVVLQDRGEQVRLLQGVQPVRRLLSARVVNEGVAILGQEGRLVERVALYVVIHTIDLFDCVHQLVPWMRILLSIQVIHPAAGCHVLVYILVIE